MKKKRPSNLKDYEKTHKIAIRFVKPHLDAPTSPQTILGGSYTADLDSLERYFEKQEQRKQRGIIFNWYITIIISVFTGILIGWLII
jgi:hypothetical protein